MVIASGAGVRQSLVGYFVQQTFSSLSDISYFCRKFHCKMYENVRRISGIFILHFLLNIYLQDIVLDLLLMDKMFSKIKPLCQTFSKFAGHVGQVQGILRTLVRESYCTKNVLQFLSITAHKAMLSN